MIFRILKKALIYLTLVTIIVVSHAPINFTSSIIYPNFLFLFIFSFLVLEKRYLSTFLLIICGILNDYIEGTLIGITSLQLVIFSIFIKKNYKALDEQKFTISWIAFVISILIIYSIKIILLSLYYKLLLFNARILFEFILTAAFYPIIYFAFYKILLILRQSEYER